MAETEQNDRPSSSNDASAEGAAKKRRRRRGKRRPGGEGGDGGADAGSGGPEAKEPAENRQRAPRAESAQGGADAGSEGGDADGQRSSRSRRRKKKRPENEGAQGQSRPDAKDASAPASGEGAAEASDQAPKDGDSGNRRSGGRSRRDGAKGRPEKKERAPRGSVLDRRRTRGEATLDFPDDDEPMMPVAPTPTATSVDGYIKQLRGWQREVVMTLRSIIKSQAAEASEEILWSQPVYTLNGPICYVKAFSDHVNLGFWRGNELDDPSERLIGELPTMRHITMRHVNDVDRDLFEVLVRQAVKLNKEKGDATA